MIKTENRTRPSTTGKVNSQLLFLSEHSYARVKTKQFQNKNMQ